MTEGYSAKRCSRCGATWKGTEPLPVVCPECDGPADDHEHQFPEVIIEGDRVLFPCLLCSLPALDAIAQMKAERAAEVVSQPPQEKAKACANCGWWGKSIVCLHCGRERASGIKPFPASAEGSIPSPTESTK